MSLNTASLKPIYKEVFADLETPLTAYLKVAGHPSFLLESVEQGERIARYSFIGSGYHIPNCHYCDCDYCVIGLFSDFSCWVFAEIITINKWCKKLFLFRACLQFNR